MSVVRGFGYALWLEVCGCGRLLVSGVCYCIQIRVLGCWTIDVFGMFVCLKFCDIYNTNIFADKLSERKTERQRY